MTGSDSKQAETLFLGIVDYYANISGSDITSAQVIQRDKILKFAGIVCDDSLDSEILLLQDEFISADYLPTPDETQAKKNHIIESTIKLLS
ncbi:TPA: hypothetical protein ACS3AG_001165 [Klebsiella pneumoniae]